MSILRPPPPLLTCRCLLLPLAEASAPPLTLSAGDGLTGGLLSPLVHLRVNLCYSLVLTILLGILSLQKHTPVQHKPLCAPPFPVITILGFQGGLRIFLVFPAATLIAFLYSAWKTWPAHDLKRAEVVVSRFAETGTFESRGCRTRCIWAKPAFFRTEVGTRPLPSTSWATPS